jgi:hypothetical protein
MLMNLQRLGMTHNTVYEIFTALFIVMILYILHTLCVLYVYGLWHNLLQF